MKMIPSGQKPYKTRKAKIKRNKHATKQPNKNKQKANNKKQYVYIYTPQKPNNANNYKPKYTKTRNSC